MSKPIGPYDIQYPTEAEQEIIKQLQFLEENTKDVAAEFGRLVRLANQYVQADAENKEPEQSRFKLHQLCNQCQTDRSSDSDDSDDVEAERQLRFRLQICMVRSLAFKFNRAILVWLHGVYLTINECVECYKGFLRAKNQLGPLFLHSYGEANLVQFLAWAEEWEEKNALDMLKERDVLGGDSKVPLRKTELYATLMLAGMLAARDQRQGLYKVLLAGRDKLQIPCLEETPVGLLAFHIDQDEDLRLWARKQAMPPPMSAEISSTKAVQSLLNSFNADSDPQDTAILTQIAPEAFDGAALPKTYLAKLSTSDSDPAAVLHQFGVVLQSKGFNLWETEDPEYPLVVLTTILDNDRYRSCLLQQHTTQGLFSWMIPMLVSLLPHHHARRGQDQEGKADLQQDLQTGSQDGHDQRAQVFEDSLKRLIHFLIETMQQGRLDVARREVTFSQAIALLRHFVPTGTESEDEKDSSSFSAKAVAQVATLHASSLANFALRGRLPGTAEIVHESSEVRNSALHLLQSLFMMDCNNLADGLLLLSTLAIQHQSQYKRLLKQQHNSKGSNSREEFEAGIDKLFQDAAASMDIHPWISSDLWRESYNAFRPSDDVALFLQPLATLSTFVQPQINSHIIAAKTQHLNSTSYQTYKERLKACLLGFTRRLRSMRGNLPQLLLDISDENGIKGGTASQVLSTISYKLTDGVVQANLCPEPDIHKAAQNLVRSTFEDAETRADCFLSLLQCHSSLALTGIEQYLESFLVAASTLVEANDAAKWMVRSFSDILDVFCDQTDGLLRGGTLHSLVDNAGARAHLQRSLPAIWQLMCRSIAVIFKRTPSWSRILPHAELTAWFRDVLLFASELVDQVDVFQSAIGSGDGREVDHQTKSNILTDLSIPLEEASSWFRINDIEIVQETKGFFIKGLQLFKGEDKLPVSVKERMLAFIDEQSKIEDNQARMTLLTLRELSELRHLLDPKAVIEIEDSDEEEGDSDTLSGIHTPPRITEREAVPRTEPVLERPNRSEKEVERPRKEQQVKPKQQKLSFQSVPSSVATSKPFISKPAPPKPPRPQFASTATPANRYQSATAKPSKSSGALAEARRNFNATSVWKNRNVIYPPPHRPYSSARELPEPQAPAAKRSFAIVPQDTNKAPPRAEDPPTESESSEDESEEEALGLADLTMDKKSPIKMRPKPKAPQKPPAKRTIIKEDLELRRRQREQEEAERKRKLKEKPNLSPLHRLILSWDFYAEGAQPPASSLGDGKAPLYEALRSTYRNPQEYMDTFTPMLLLEAWAEFGGARQQMGRETKGDNSPRTVTVTGRSAVDSFTVVTVIVQNQQGKQSLPFNDSEIVYLREIGVADRPKAALAKVDAFKFDPARRLDRLTLRCCLDQDAQGMSSLLTGGAALEMGRLFSLTTLHREYEALQVMQYYLLLPSILLAKGSVREVLAEDEVQQAQANYGVNRPQAEAILSALKAKQGFNLIQGPPGTGKTKTICSLVAHFIQTRAAPAVPIRAGQAGMAVGVKKKILLCAPSNAAVDEVAKRVHEGVKLPNGKMIKPQVVRLGREEAMNVSAKIFSLDSIVERRMASSTTANSSSQGADSAMAEDAPTLHAEIRRLKDLRDAKRAELETVRLTNGDKKAIAQLDADVRQLSVRRMEVMSKLDEVKDQRQTANRQQTADRKRIEQEVLAGADVVCTTLGGAGHGTLGELPFEFETVVIDEAAQAVELDTLIPLRYGCERCILVGDPNQLPPTVISKEAERLKYSRSLFVRLFDNPNNNSNLLSIQYRMHPRISRFPSVEFYNGKLADGPDMAALTQKPWHGDNLLAPFRFFDCQRSKELSARGMSLMNREEASMAAAIYERLRRETVRAGSGYSVERKVGVISMYKEQIFELKRAFQSIYGPGIDDAVDFNTVDGFQGQEKDTIILSCVRSSGIGFLSDFRRVNVAITRAKSNLFIIGNVANLERTGGGTVWPRLIHMARTEGCLLSVTSDDFRRAAVPTATVPNPALGRPLPSNGYTISAAPSNGSSASYPRPRANPALAVSATAKRKASDIAASSDAGSSSRQKIAAIDKADSSSMPRNPPRPGYAGGTGRGGMPANGYRGSARPARPVPRPVPARPTARPSVVRPPVSTSATTAPAPHTASAIPILPPGPVANAPRPNPRPVQLRPPPATRTPVFSSQEGPSEKAKSSLFMKKPMRTVRPKKR